MFHLKVSKLSTQSLDYLIELDQDKNVKTEI